MYSSHCTASINNCKKTHSIATTEKLRSLKWLIPKTPPLFIWLCINWLHNGYRNLNRRMGVLITPMALAYPVFYPCHCHTLYKIMLCCTMLYWATLCGWYVQLAILFCEWMLLQWERLLCLKLSFLQQSSTLCPAWIWSNNQRFICPQAKWERGHDATPYLCHWSQSRVSHGLCRVWCQIGLSPEDTRFSTRNAQLQPKETQPHRRSEEIHDLQTRSSC